MEWQEGITKTQSDWDRDGYLFVETFVSSDKAEDISDNICRYIKEVIPGLPSDAAMYEDPNRPDTIFRLSDMESHDAYSKDLYEDEHFINLARGSAATTPIP